MTAQNKLPSIVMLDNLDSFTYNLVDEFKCLGFEPTIYRNTLAADFVLSKIQQLANENSAGVILVLSPGPGDPSHAGCLMELIEKTAGKYPILGICLGHQALIQHYGGVIGRAPEIVHGKSSNVTHSGTGCFSNIQQPLPVARYHSLVATLMPEGLDMIAHYDAMLPQSDRQDSAENSSQSIYPNSAQKDSENNGENTNLSQCLPMAIEHQADAVIGFQFHPESILTTYGSTLLSQSLLRLSELNTKN